MPGVQLPNEHGTKKEETHSEWKTLVIVPRVMEEVVADADEEETIEIVEAPVEETEYEKHQHFFADQLHLKRPKWEHWWFTSAAFIAFSVHTSAVDSFPYNVAANGGVVFIVMYLVCTAVFGLPLLYLEVIVGQYFQTNMLGIWGLCPLFRAIGAEIFVGCLFATATTPAEILWATKMFYYSCRSLIAGGKLPWATCDNDWNSCLCEDSLNSRHPLCPSELSNATSQSPEKEFFLAIILKVWKSKSEDPQLIRTIPENGNWSISYSFNNTKDGLGELVPSSVIIVIVIFLIIIVFTLTNLKYTGYFCTLTAGFPLLALLLLLCRAATLDGAEVGLAQYLKPDFTKLGDLTVWYTAATASLFSLGTGYGVHIATASFSRLHHNHLRDCVLCVVFDFSTSFLSCFACFMYVGISYTRNRLSLPVHFPAEEFSYIGFAEAISNVSGSPMFACAFYLMLMLFTFDTLAITVRMLAQSLQYEYKRAYPNQAVSGYQVLFAYLGFTLCVSLMFITRGGIWAHVFVAKYAFGISVLAVMFVECLVFAWLWGIDEICHCAEGIGGNRPNIFMRISWKFLIPGLILICAVKTFREQYTYSRIEAFGFYLPESSFIFGCFVQSFPFTIVIGYGVYIIIKMRRRSNSNRQMLMLLISPQYEHASILENVKNAKRLHWKHYITIRTQDEIDEGPIHLKLKICAAKLCHTCMSLFRTKSVESFHQLGIYENVEGSETRSSQASTETGDLDSGTESFSRFGTSTANSSDTPSIMLESKHSILIGGHKYKEEHGHDPVSVPNHGKRHDIKPSDNHNIHFKHNKIAPKH